MFYSTKRKHKDCCHQARPRQVSQFASGRDWCWSCRRGEAGITRSFWVWGVERPEAKRAPRWERPEAKRALHLGTEGGKRAVARPAPRRTMFGLIGERTKVSSRVKAAHTSSWGREVWGGEAILVVAFVVAAAAPCGCWGGERGQILLAIMVFVAVANLSAVVVVAVLKEDSGYEWRFKILGSSISKLAIYIMIISISSYFKKKYPNHESSIIEFSLKIQPSLMLPIGRKFIME